MRKRIGLSSPTFHPWVTPDCGRVTTGVSVGVNESYLDKFGLSSGLPVSKPYTFLRVREPLSRAPVPLLHV